jgi:hypothetical protein
MFFFHSGHKVKANKGQRLREAKIDTKHHGQHICKVNASTRCNCKPSSDPESHDQVSLSTFSLDDFTSMTSDPIDPTLSLTSVSQSLLHLDMAIAGLNDLNPSPFDDNSPTILSPQSQPSLQLTVFSALFLNGQILGLSCRVCFSSQSPHPSPHHPVSLHPTESQLLIIHPRWYDGIPFARMRDNLIKMNGVIDEDELLRDLFTMPSWRIETGGKGGRSWQEASWDPRAWKMHEEWRAKWGWLML